MIVTTHQDGLIRLYRLNGDAALTQVGQLTAPEPLDPVLLATMAADLTQALHWEHSTNGTPPTPVQPVPPPKPTATKRKPGKSGRPATKKPTGPKPATPAKKKVPTGSYRTKPRASREEVQARKNTILTHLSTVGPASATTLGQLLFPGQDPENAESRARKIIDQLVRDGYVTRIPSGSRTVASTYAYTFVDPDVG